MRLLHLVTFATSHVLFPVLGDRQHQHYPGLLVSLMTDLRVVSFEQQGGLGQHGSCMACGNDKEIQRKRSIRTPQR